MPKKNILAILVLILCMGHLGDATAQLDCDALIQRLNDTRKAPGVFDAEFIIGKYGLEHATCEKPRGAVHCFKCLDKTGIKTVEIVIAENGRVVSPPKYGCQCGLDVKWDQAP